MRKIILEMSFNAFSGLHGGLVLFEKIYLNPRSQIGLIWEKLFLKMGFQCLFGLTRGFSTI
jgi:hypothetical protein